MVKMLRYDTYGKDEENEEGGIQMNKSTCERHERRGLW